MKRFPLFLLLLLAACASPLPASTPTPSAPAPTAVLSTETSAPESTAYPFPPFNALAPESTTFPYPPFDTSAPSQDYYPPPAAAGTPEPTALPTATYRPTPTIDPAQHLQHIEQEWRSFYQSPPEPPAFFKADRSLAGLIFQDNRGHTWRIAADGSPVFLFTGDGKLSPQGNRVVFKDLNVIFAADTATGEVRRVSDGSVQYGRHIAGISPDGQLITYTENNQPSKGGDEVDPARVDLWVYSWKSDRHWRLTDTPEIQEGGAYPWPGRPDWIYYWEHRPSQAGPDDTGTFAAMNITDPSPVRFSPDPFYEAAISPDGQRLLYRTEKGWFIWSESGTRPLDLSRISLPGWKIYNMDRVQWSPDGKSICAASAAEKDGASWSGILVLHLAQNSAVFLHPYHPIGRGWSSLSGRWSPNGRWLIINAGDDEVVDRSGYWIIHPDGSGEHFLGRDLDTKFWSPDSRQLVILRYNSSRQFSLLNLTNWTEKPLPGDLPAGSLDNLSDILLWNRAQ